MAIIAQRRHHRRRRLVASSRFIIVVITRPPFTPQTSARGGGGAPETAQYDEAFARPQRAAPADAAALLARDDADVSHVAAFGILKDMAADEAYKADVLALLR